MPNVSVKVPSFVQGVSTQPDTQKIAGSAAEIVNGYVDVATGLSKRNGLKFQFTLNASNPADTYSIHWLETGGAEFMMLVSDDVTEPIQVFALSDGRKITINYANAASKTYVQSGSGDTRWRVLSVFDSTFIVNTTVTVALTGAASSYTPTVVLELPTPASGTAGNYYQSLQSSLGRPAGFYQQNSPWDVDEADKFTRLKSTAANSDFDADTMPVQMVYDSGTDEFTVQQPTWVPRYSGDEITNPGPSFVGRTLTDIVFHKNRLWLFADEVISSSSAKNFFNFWLDDVYNVTDGDPIDEFVSDQGLNKIQYAVPFNKALILFTEGDRQFEVRSNGPLTPSSISIIPTTSYGVSGQTRPIQLGSQMYFFTEYHDYGQMFEYYYIDNAANNVANDVTEHVKTYINESITNMTGEVNNGLLVSHGTGTRNIFPYKMTWSQNQKFQSAWSKWTLPDTGHTILSSKVYDDKVWLLLTVTGASTTKLVLAYIPVVTQETDTDINYSIHLDYLNTSSSGTYDSGTNTTYWDLPYNAGSNTVVVIPVSGSKPGMSLDPTVTEQSEHVSRVTVTGDYSSEDMVFGIPFDFSLQLNVPYVKDRNDSPVTGSLSVKKLILYVKNLVQFSIVQQVPGISTPYNAFYTASQISANNVVYDQVPVEAFDNPSFVMLGKATEMTITISDTSEFPLTLVSAEFRGSFNPRRPVR